MSWLANLRLLVFVRRGVIALESLADSLRIISQLLQRQWDEDHPPPHERGKLTFESLDIPAANKRWRQEQVARGIMVEEEK